LARGLTCLSSWGPDLAHVSDVAANASVAALESDSRKHDVYAACTGLVNSC